MKTVFFNASVILAGLRSPRGGSGKVLDWTKRRKIKGYISEAVLDEVLRHVSKVGLQKNDVVRRIKVMLIKIVPAPERVSKKYMKLVKDYGDIHLFESVESLKVDYLVSLDKRHVLSLARKVKGFKVKSPGELIEALS